MSSTQKDQSSKPLGAVIAVGNQKGGVGKSTVTVHLAAALGNMGHRVLVVDLDPSAGATRHLGVDPYAYEGTVELLTDRADPMVLAIIEDMPENVALIAARSDLASNNRHDTHRLRECLEPASSEFDFIFLDTAPNPRSPNTFAAYAAAEWFLFVATPHALAIHGLSEALRDIGTIRQGPNPELEILGTVFNIVDTRTLAVKEAKAFLKKHKNLRPFKRMPFIPQSVFLNRAAEQGRTTFQIPVYRYKAVSLCFEYIAEELAQRCLRESDSGSISIQPYEEPKSDQSTLTMKTV